MIRNAWWLIRANMLVLLWQECGENPAVFCYRISLGVFATARARGYVNFPSLQDNSRDNAECLTQFFTSSTRFLTPRDSRS